MRLVYMVQWSRPVYFSLTLFAVGFLVTYILVDPSWFARASADSSVGDFFPKTASGIFVRNLGVATLIYAGVASAGIITIFSELAVAMFLGASVRVAAFYAGLGNLLSHVWFYSVFEIAAFVIAGAAGVNPVVQVWISHRHADIRSQLKGYMRGINQSLVALAISAGFLVVAALAESAVL